MCIHRYNNKPGCVPVDSQVDYNGYLNPTTGELISEQLTKKNMYRVRVDSFFVVFISGKVEKQIYLSGK